MLNKLQIIHFPLCPFSRFLRLILKEKGCEFESKNENYWERSAELLALNPLGEVPILKIDNEYYNDVNSIAFLLEDLYKDVALSSSDIYQKYEIMKLLSWINHRFYREVTRYIIDERVIKFYLHGYPNSNFIRAAKFNTSYHLNYFSKLLETREWLALENISLPDFALAAQISTLDYLGDMDWGHYPRIKEWYALIKSRPSFRTILTDRIKGFAPSDHYTNLDF